MHVHSGSSDLTDAVKALALVVCVTLAGSACAEPDEVRLSRLNAKQTACVGADVLSGLVDSLPVLADARRSVLEDQLRQADSLVTSLERGRQAFIEDLALDVQAGIALGGSRTQLLRAGQADRRAYDDRLAEATRIRDGLDDQRGTLDVEVAALLVRALYAHRIGLVAEYSDSAANWAATPEDSLRYAQVATIHEGMATTLGEQLPGVSLDVDLMWAEVRSDPSHVCNSPDLGERPGVGPEPPDSADYIMIAEG